MNESHLAPPSGTSDLSTPNTIANFASCTPADNITKAASAARSSLAATTRYHSLQTPNKVAQLNNLGSPKHFISKSATAQKPSWARRSLHQRLSSPLRKLAKSISKTPSTINRQPASVAESSLGTPSIIVNFDDQGREIPRPTSDFYPSSPKLAAADPRNSLNTPPDLQTPNNNIPKSAEALKPFLANQFPRRPFSSPVRKLAKPVSKTSSIINRNLAAESSLGTPSTICQFDDQGQALPPWTPGFHPSSSNFFAADSPVFVAPMAAKRSSPSADDDFETPRAPKRIKTESQRDQSAAPVASLRKSPPSRHSSGTLATVYKSNNVRTPAPLAKHRKRARVDDEEDDDDDYSASSHSDSDASQVNRVAKTDPTGKRTTIDKFPSPSAPFTTPSKRRAKRLRRARSDSLYVDEEASDDGEFEIPEAYERNQLGLNNLTRERARRLANAVKVPQNSNMCDEERDLYAELALRGIKPVMSYDWARDFSTLPESIFSAPNASKEDEDKLALKADKGTEFAAKKAFQELLKVGGLVRDCRILTVQPEAVIERAIRKYIRWAMTDAGLKTTPETIPVHAIVVQRPAQSTLSAVAGLGKRLERLAQKHQKVHGHRMDAYLPSLVGFLICGPILSIMTLDTNPRSEVWTRERGDGEDDQPRAKYLGMFDMSDIDSDVWNSLAVALAVINVRQSMVRLANAYEGSLFPRFRGHGDDSDDEDL